MTTTTDIDAPLGLLIISHHLLGEALEQCAVHILGRQIPNLAHLSVSRGDDPAEVLERAREKIRMLDQGRGVLLLTDIYGGTPSNIASRLIQAGRVEAIAGVSLPMLIRALTYSHESLETAVSKAITGGWEGVIYMLPEIPADPKKTNVDH